MVNLYLQGICSGLLLGGVYGLIAIGLTLIFGVLKIINFAHGEFLMVGMYFTFMFWILTGMSPYASIPLVAVALFLVGMAVFYFLIRPVLEAEELNQILLTMGVAWVLQNLALLIFSSNVQKVKVEIGLKAFSLFEISIGYVRLIAFITSIFCAYLIYLLLHRTNIGRIIRAASDNRDAALRMGVNVNRVYMISFGIGMACLGVAAPLLVAFYQITPYVGLTFTLMAFIIVVLGSLASLKGAIIGGLLIGVTESLGSIIFPGTWGAITPYILFLIVLLFKPDGLFPREGL